MTTADGSKGNEGVAGASSLPFGQDHRYHLLVDSIEDYAIYLLDADGRVASWNRGAQKIFDYRADEIIGRDFEVFFTEEERKAGIPRKSLARAAESDGIVTEEAVRVRRDGSHFWSQISIRAIRDAEGRLLGYSKITRDSTERRSVEAQRLMASAVLDYSPDSIIVLNQSGQIERVNDRAIAMFGLPRNSLIGAHIEVLLPERYRDRHIAHRDVYFAKPSTREMGSGLELYARRADGSEFPVDVVLGPLILEGRRYVIAIVRDITERKAAAETLARVQRDQAVAEERARAGEALRRTSETLEKIVQASPLAIIAVDSQNRVEIWNSTAEQMFETAAADVLGRERPQLWSDLNIKTDGSAASLREAALGARTLRNQEGSLRRSDGTLLNLNVSIAALGDSGGRGDGFLFLVDDVTQHRATENHLRQAQKMDAIGQLTGGIAHDFNNLLAIIYGNLELILERVETDQLRDLTEDALNAAERGASLTHRLLAYARQQQLAPTLVDIEKLIRDLSTVLRRTIEESIRIDLNIAAGLWPARIDAHQLENSLINLAVNARDAMPQGGRLSIVAENAELDHHYTSEIPDLSPGDYIMVSVSDTGTGMPKHVVEKALEPFFTTKPVGRGTGLGLSMVYGFIKQSGGHLKIYSEQGHGTSVKLFLPRATDGAVLRHVPARSAAPDDYGGRVVLVVEDQEAVRRLQIRFLESLGFRTLEAPDGLVGFAVLKAHPEIDLVLTDVVLPNGVSGVDLASAVRQSKPETKIVFMSGYSPHAMTMPQNLRDIPVLSKPFARSQLVETLAELYGRRPE